jgi:hypothetical protein
MGLVKSIELPNMFAIYTNADGNPYGSLCPTSNINIFVGENNSGKSRFMRMLSGQSEYQATLSDIDLVNVNSQIETIISNLKNALTERGLRHANNFDAQSVQQLMPLPHSLSLNSDNYQKLREAFTKWSDFPDVTSWSSLSSMGLGHISDETKRSFRDAVRNQAAEAVRILDQVPRQSAFSTPKKVYIPVLRSLRPITPDHADLYSERIVLDYFTADSGLAQPEIFTGLSLYKRLTEMLLGGNQERKIISEYQTFMSKTLFGGRSITLIPSLNSKAVVVKIGNEKEQPIFHLGDGIQSAIILSFLPYITRESTFFFIEEPEMYLHPGLQRKILEFFNSLNHHMFFLTTHSNHFLDLTIDIKDVSIFTFRKQLREHDTEDDEVNPTFVIEAVDSGDRSSLELLGVRNSSVFLVNATIWVEGITDRWYLRTMLDSYVDYLEQTGGLRLKIEEDVHYSFVEYAGANITHWSFLEDEDQPIEVERLCSKALVIIDRDGNTKLQRKEELAKTLGDRLVILPSREVENLLPYSVIKKVILEYERDPNRELPDKVYASYEGEYLGKFIEDSILEGRFNRKGGYKSPSGTLKSKVDFCEKARHMLQYSDLPSTTQELVKKIYDFILSQNM